MFLVSKIKSGIKWSWSLEDSSLDNIVWHLRKFMRMFGIRMNDELTQLDLNVFVLFIASANQYMVSLFGIIYSVFVTKGHEQISSESTACIMLSLYFKVIWIVLKRKEILEILLMAKTQNTSLTKIEEDAFSQEMKITKWRCRTYFIGSTVNATLFLYFPMFFGSMEPQYPAIYPGLEDKTIHRNFIFYHIIGPVFLSCHHAAVVSYGFIVLILLGHAGSHATAIAAEISSLKETALNRPEEVSERVTYVLTRYKNLKTYIEKVNDLFSIVIGLDYPMYAITSAVSFQNPSTDTVNILLYATVSFLTFCYLGQYLINKGECIAVAVYASGWELMKEKDTKKLLIMLQNAQAPMTLTTLKVITLTHPTFMTFIRLLYSAGACAFGTSNNEVKSDR